MNRKSKVDVMWVSAFRQKTIFLSLVAILFAVLRMLPAQSPAHAQISTLQNGIELTDGSSSLDVQILEDRTVRVHVRLDGKNTPRTLVMDPHPQLRGPKFVNRSDKNGLYTLSTPDVLVHIRETKPYSIAFLNSDGQELLRSEDPFREAQNTGVTLSHAAGETFYGIHGLGRDDTTVGLTRNQGGHVAAGIQGDSGAPFIFSARYGLLVDSDGGDFTTESKNLTFLHSSRLDVEYFVLTGSPLETMAALSRLVGPPPLPPKWTLGFLNSQWGSTQAEVEQIVARYRKEELPLDGFILDFDWKAWGEDNYGEWRWNSTAGPGNVAPSKFPDGASGEFARRLSAEGVKLAGILKPRILDDVAGNPNQPTLAAAYANEHNLWYPGEPQMPDYFSHRMARDLDFNIPETRAWFWEHLKPAFQAGMAGWWNDEADLSGDTVFGNFQFLNMGRMLYDGQRADSNRRVWSINRNFYLGASRYGYAGWSGDIQTGFNSMAFQRRRMLAALDTGEFNWSMDTGGFKGHPSSENYARWLEFAAFIPIMRVHGDLDEKRQPWVYGQVAEAAARKALDLRYELIPYIYSYRRLNTEGEVGLIRPLFWEFPGDPASATQESEWMFGDALLVSPIVGQGATSEQIYLPPGQWFDYASGQAYAGAQTIQIAADFNTWQDIPLFVRNGSILVTQPVEQYVEQRPATELTLDVFPYESAAAFTVYDDDGETYNYEKGEYFRQQIDAQRQGAATKVTIESATGNYASTISVYLLRIHANARNATLNGRPLPEVNALASPSLPGRNWSRQNDRFGPVVLIRVSAGAKTPSTITLH